MTVIISKSYLKRYRQDDRFSGDAIVRLEKNIKSGKVAVIDDADYNKLMRWA